MAHTPQVRDCRLDSFELDEPCDFALLVHPLTSWLFQEPPLYKSQLKGWMCRL